MKNPVTTQQVKKPRGFAAMTPEQRQAIARKGGQTAHAMGVAHKYTSEEGRSAGQKGGHSVSRDSRHMAVIGAKGGKNSHARRK